MTSPTREDAFAAVKSLNEKIAALACGATINAAKYTHEIDVGYGRVDCVADVIKMLAAKVQWLRHQAARVNIPDGSYAWAIKLCEQAEMLAGQIELIEGRAS